MKKLAKLTLVSILTAVVFNANAYAKKPQQTMAIPVNRKEASNVPANPAGNIESRNLNDGSINTNVNTSNDNGAMSNSAIGASVTRSAAGSVGNADDKH